MPESVDESPTPVVRRSRWQFGLRAMFVLTALVAVWTAHFGNLREIGRLQGRIDSISPLVPELVVADPAQFAFVKLEPLWSDDNRWDLHVPPGSYRIGLATRGIEQAGFPPAVRWAPLPTGRHVMELKQSEEADGRRISVLVDGSPLVEAEETKEWSTGPGFSTSEAAGEGNGPAGEARPHFTFRRRFMVPRDDRTSAPPDGPGDGLLFWIERYEPAAGEPGGDSSKMPTGREALPSSTPDFE